MAFGKHSCNTLHREHAVQRRSSVAVNQTKSIKQSDRQKFCNIRWGACKIRAAACFSWLYSEAAAACSTFFLRLIWSSSCEKWWIRDIMTRLRRLETSLTFDCQHQKWNHKASKYSLTSNWLQKRQRWCTIQPGRPKKLLMPSHNHLD